jgi:hypothetical protein
MVSSRPGESDPNTSATPEAWGLDNVLATLVALRHAGRQFDTARITYAERKRFGLEKAEYHVRPTSPQASWDATLVGRKVGEAMYPQVQQEVTHSNPFKAHDAEPRPLKYGSTDKLEIVFLREATSGEIDESTRSAFPDHTWQWELVIPEHLIESHLELLLDRPGKEPAPYWLGGQAVAGALPERPPAGGIAGTGIGLH